MNVIQINILLRRLVVVIVESIADCGEDGVPGGTLYAALMCHGATLENFEQLMEAMQELHLVRKELRGHRYFITEAGRKLVTPANPVNQAGAPAG
jgi:hypothetical protein